MVLQLQLLLGANFRTNSSNYGDLSAITGGWNQDFATTQGSDYDATQHDLYEAIRTIDPASFSFMPNPSLVSTVVTITFSTPFKVDAETGPAGATGPTGP